jgi:hypothetical protein
MKEKWMSVMLVLCLSFSILGSTAFANPEISVESEHTISREDAAKIVLLFVANSIEDNKDSSWNEDTRLASIDETIDVEGTVNSYTFIFENRGQPNGYVVVSANTDMGIILEYSDTAEPLYKAIGGQYDEIIYTAPLEYYVSSGEDAYKVELEEKQAAKGENKSFRRLDRVHKHDLQDRFNHARKDKDNNRIVVDTIVNIVDEEAEELLMGSSSYSGQVDGYAVDSGVYNYVNARYGTGYSLQTSKVVSSAGSALLMSSFTNNSNHCVITALTYVFDYHRRNNGKTAIPSNIQTLFNDIKTVATANGYTPTGGTPPTKIDNIIKDVWTKYGYSGTGSSVYVFSESTFKTEIDNNRPALLNISFGYYGNHTVTMIGYLVYSKSTFLGSTERFFMRVNDGWTTSVRYIDYDAITNPFSGDFSTLSISRITP